MQPVEVVGAADPSEPAWTLIADGPEDADARITVEAPEGMWFGERVDHAIGDVDGDGYDDYLTNNFQVFYGGPRGVVGAFPAEDAGATTFTFNPENVPSPPSEAGIDASSISAGPAGDVNGDGCADILFENRRMVGGSDTSLETLSAHRAYLWYGRPERPLGDVRLDDDGVQFEPLDDLREALSESASYGVDQNLRLVGLGDLDGDGFDDLAYSYYVLTFDVDLPRRAATLIYYGSPARLPTRGAVTLADARIADVPMTGPLGDIDGDGSADFWFLSASQDDFRVAFSGAERLPIEGSADELGRTTQVQYPPSMLRAVGDVDRDGIDDFTVLGLAGENHRTSVTQLFYGSPSWSTTTIEHDLADAVFYNEEDHAGLTGLGDWDGDGFEDLALSDYVDPSEGPRRGEAQLIRGTAARYAGDYVIEGFSTNALPNTSVHRSFNPELYSIGDLDGDGFDDIVFSMAFYLSESRDSYEKGWFIKYGGPLVSDIH